jgi:hypothetical protein
MTGFRRHEVELVSLLIVAASFIHPGPAQGQAGCYICGYSGTRCRDNESSGMTGCESTGGQCTVSGNACGITGGGGFEPPPDPPMLPPPHRAGRPREDGRAFARLLTGAAFVLQEYEPTGGPARSEIHRAAGSGLGAQSLLSLLSQIHKVSSERLSLIGTLVSVGGSSGARRYILAENIGLVASVDLEADGADLRVGVGQDLSVRADLRYADLLEVVIPEGNSKMILCFQALARPKSTENDAVISRTLATVYDDTDAYHGRVGFDSLRFLAAEADGQSVRQGTWGSVKILYR